MHNEIFQCNIDDRMYKKALSIRFAYHNDSLRTIRDLWLDLKTKRTQNESDLLATLACPKFDNYGEFEYELVVARYNEDLSWLNRINEKILITVYNKGDDLKTLPPRTRLIKLTNIGRESHTYSIHCALRYDTLANNTIFTQADPTPHSPHFIDLVNSLEFPNNYTSLSLRYLQNIPPPEVVNDKKKTHLEKIDCFTLNSISWNDTGTIHVYKNYLKFYNLPEGTHILHHHFSQIGLYEHIDTNHKNVLFSYGAIFAVNRTSIIQHSRDIFVNIANLSKQHWSIGYIMEKSWYLLFDKHNALST